MPPKRREVGVRGEPMELLSEIIENSGEGDIPHRRVLRLE
jgi:hypothetical protein